MDEPLAPRAIERTFALDDIAIRSGGDGRTVVAYAAVFDTPAEIRDRDGHYLETINRSAFDRALTRKRPQVFYNHGKTLYGTPSERFSMPLGVPEEIKPDQRGLLTVTRYNRNDLADQVLESIRNGDITGQSFSGKTYQSKKTPAARGGLPTIHRTELGLAEYGPTPIPAYHDPMMVTVRMEELVDTFRGLTDEERQELLELLGTSRSLESSPPSTEPAAPGPSADTDTPADRPVSPTPAERRERALLLKGVTL